MSTDVQSKEKVELDVTEENVERIVALLREFAKTPFEFTHCFCESMEDITKCETRGVNYIEAEVNITLNERPETFPIIRITAPGQDFEIGIKKGFSLTFSEEVLLLPTSRPSGKMFHAICLKHIS